MTLPDSLQQYAALLRIRQAGARRAVLVTGAVFCVSTFAALLSNLLMEPNNRSLFLNAVLIVAFGMSFAFAWSRYETIKGIAELVDELHEAKRRL